MTETLHANIFFLITSIAVVLFTILLCVVMVYLIKIVRIIHRLMERVEEGSEIVAEDLANLREMMRIEQIISFFMGKMGMKARRRRKNTTRK